MDRQLWMDFRQSDLGLCKENRQFPVSGLRCLEHADAIDDGVGRSVAFLDKLLNHISHALLGGRAHGWHLEGLTVGIGARDKCVRIGPSIEQEESDLALSVDHAAHEGAYAIYVSVRIGATIDVASEH